MTSTSPAAAAHPVAKKKKKNRSRVGSVGKDVTTTVVYCCENGAFDSLVSSTFMPKNVGPAVHVSPGRR